LQSYLLLRFKCGPHPYRYRYKRRSVHASALFYSSHDSNIRIKPVELAENYPRFRFCCSSSIWVYCFGLHHSFLYLSQTRYREGPLPSSVSVICGGGWMSSISGGYRCFSWKTSQVFNS
jgi:hypothetical protein